MSKRAFHVIAGTLLLAGGSMMASAASVWPPSAVDLGDVSMTATIGGESFNNIDLTWVESTDPTTGKQGFTLAGGPIILTTEDGSTLTIGDATFRPDPLLLFSASATNNGNNPLAYSFAFNAPMSPSLTGLVTSHAELGVTLTDGLNNGATVQPVSGLMLHSFDVYATGTTVSKNVDIGTPFSIPNSTNSTTYSADGTLICTQACVTMSSVLTFTLTGHDAVAFTGKVTQDVAPVPVPAAAFLLGSGLLGLFGFRRKISA